MITINSNAIKILANIPDVVKNRGLIPARGMTKEAIYNQYKNNCKGNVVSLVTFDRALKVLKQNGLIEEGIRQVSKKTYYVTEEGKNFLRDIKGKGSF